VSERVTVFTGTENAAERVAAFLAEREIDATETKKPGPVLAKAGRRGRRVRVQVPRAQLEPARVAVAEWRGAHRSRTRGPMRQLGAAFLLSLIPPAFWLGASFGGVSGVPAPDPFFVAGLWMLSLVVFTGALGRRRRAERVERPRSPSRTSST
jgi:hypothetical protein